MSQIRYRHFKNTDILGLVDVWNRSEQPRDVSQMHSAGLRQPIDTLLFDTVVISSQFFRPEFLLVAVEVPDDGAPFDGRHDGRVVGFIHGGDVPKKDFSGIDSQTKAIAMLLVEEREDQLQIAAELLHRLEAIFQQAGAREILAGASYPNAPFYMGLLASGGICGFLEGNTLTSFVLQSNGYLPVTRYHLFRIPLRNYRAPVNRDTIRMRRKFYIEETRKENSPPQNLWEAIAMCNFDWRRFGLIDRAVPVPEGEKPKPCATVVTHRLEGASDYDVWGARWGLHNLQVEPDYQHQGHGRFLVSSVLQILASRGYGSAELQISAENVRATRSFEMLNFERFATGVVYHRTISEL